MLPVRFLADANLDHDIVAGVLRRDPRIDFEIAPGTLPEGLKDPEVLAVAASLDRVLVSYDVHTMPGHFAEFVMQQSSPGLILIPSSVSIGQAIEYLVMVWHASEAEEWVDRVVWVPG
jgi:hypothetical protein